MDDVRFTTKLIGIHFNTGEYQIGKDLFYKIKNKIYNDPNYNNFIATTLLYDGNFEEGFKFYDKRNSNFVREYSNINEWRGESLNNKKILVYFEQGLGDTLQFSKYIVPLLKICKNVTFLVQEKLADLYNKNIDGLNIVSKINIDNENFDYKIDLGSLIKFFYKEKIDNSKLIINTQKNFIQNKFIKIDKSKLNVGIVWSGSNYGPNEPYRSISLENLKKLFSLNINFYSLQSEIRDNDAEYFKSLNINNCGNFDLNEISKIIINLDLVISTDTSILHLSAILDKETWGILSLYPDWRWGEFQKINPYKSLKLFKQNKFNDWHDTISDIYNQLKIRLHKKKMNTNNLPKKISVFPLSNFIIFPKTTVPLNIFEPRYIDMINDSMKSNKLIGMIQPKNSNNEEFKPELHKIGCLGKIKSFRETDDGNFFIELKGLIRFKTIKEISSNKKYREYEVNFENFYHDLESKIEDLKFKDLELIFKDFKSLFERKGFVINWKELEKQSLDETINALAMASPFTLEEKQVLLESENLNIRRNKIADILSTYVHDVFDNTTLQ